MSTLTIPKDRLDEVQPGDRLVAIDEVTLSVARVFTGGPQRLWPNGLIGIPYEYGGVAAAYLYPDSLVERSITVEREGVEPEPVAEERGMPIAAALSPGTYIPEEETRPADEHGNRIVPAPERPRRHAARVIDGLRLVSDGKGVWRTEDGAYEVRKGYDGMTFCEGPHPVRITPALAEAARQHSTRDWAGPILTALYLGKRGYLCPGEVEHENPQAWQVWDLTRESNVSPFEESRYDSFAEAARGLATYLQKKD